MDEQTRIQHPNRVKLEEDNIPLTFPVYQSVKFALPTVEAIGQLFHGERDGFFYSRKANPTVRQLETMLAEQQGTEDAVAFASGVGAISCLYMSVLSAGDHVVLFRESYMPSRQLLQRVFSRFGVESSFIGISDMQEMERLFNERKTKLLLFESPTNPMLRIANISKIVETCRKYGVMTALDNTFAGFHQHHQFGIDIFVHSLTKYANGHGDVMGGMLCGSEELIRKIRNVATEMGACLDPHAASLIMRGMKTYFLRRERQEFNATKVAEWLERHDQISALQFPGSKGHQDFELARKQMRDFGSLVSFDLRGDNARLSRFLNALKLIKIAASVGSTETIIAPVKMFFTADMDDQARQVAKITDTTLRLSLGIELHTDIIDELARAIAESE